MTASRINSWRVIIDRRIMKERIDVSVIIIYVSSSENMVVWHWKIERISRSFLFG